MLGVAGRGATPLMRMCYLEGTSKAWHTNQHQGEEDAGVVEEVGGVVLRGSFGKDAERTGTD